jgi:hypothetical protein
MSVIERKLAEKCAEFGLPPSFDTLMRHIENNHAATYGAQRSHIETLERQLAGAVAALSVAQEALAQVTPPYSERMQAIVREALTRVTAVLREA